MEWSRCLYSNWSLTLVTHNVSIDTVLGYWTTPNIYSDVFNMCKVVIATISWKFQPFLSNNLVLKLERKHLGLDTCERDLRLFIPLHNIFSPPYVGHPRRFANTGKPRAHAFTAKNANFLTYHRTQVSKPHIFRYVVDLNWRQQIAYLCMIWQDSPYPQHDSPPLSRHRTLAWTPLLWIISTIAMSVYSCSPRHRSFHHSFHYFSDDPQPITNTMPYNTRINSSNI